MKHKFFILFTAALIVAGCSNHSDNNNSGEVPSGKEEKVDDKTPAEVQTTLIPDAVTDIDGNTYSAVKIGEQVWMAENLRVTKDRDGKEIALGSEPSSVTPYRYCPDNQPSNVEKYGYLYNWAAAKKVCPQGWHLPTDEEWTQLTDYVSSQSQYVCGDDKNNIAKALASMEGWESVSEPCAVGNNPSSNNATGFGALPAGYYHVNYGYFGYAVHFWSALENDSNNAWYRYLHNYYAVVFRCDNCGKDRGFSVRCVRD